MRRILVLFLLLIAPAPAFTQTRTDSARATLRSLIGVEVLIEDLSADAERAGLSRNQIQTDVELRLRSNRVPVLTRDASAVAPGSPYLYVQIVVSPGAQDFHGWSVDVSLVQAVVLARDTSIRIFAPTWQSRGLISFGATADLRRSVREAVSDNVDQFVNAYLAVAQPK